MAPKLADQNECNRVQWKDYQMCGRISRIRFFVAVLAVVALLTGSSFFRGGAAQIDETDLILATTTSTQDSGLLDVLIPMFEEQTGYKVKPVAVGSGAAIKMGEEGNADVLLVHSPAAEEAFMQDDYGSDRRLVFYNDFIIPGPVSDPAGVAQLDSAVDALTAIAATEQPFISRGDDSGTHKLELKLWEQAGIEPGGSWYVESGTGMGETLNIASERQAYTIVDRGTWLALQDNLDLKILEEGDKSLINIYHVISVNPEKYPDVNEAGALAFTDFLLHPATQKVIGKFGVEEYGQPLFVPCADNSCGIETAAATPVAATPQAA